MNSAGVDRACGRVLCDTGYRPVVGGCERGCTPLASIKSKEFLLTQGLSTFQPHGVIFLQVFELDALTWPLSLQRDRQRKEIRVLFKNAVYSWYCIASAVDEWIVGKKNYWIDTESEIEVLEENHVAVPFRPPWIPYGERLQRLETNNLSHGSSDVGWGTALQTGRSQVRLPMVSLEFFIHTILSVALWPWGQLSL
jgi:hypothetical protein